MAEKRERVKKVKALNVNPEILKLAEEEIAIRFQEHPELETEVKGRISNLIENHSGRQLVDAQTAIRYLRKNLGTELACIVCSLQAPDFNAFARSNKPRKPTGIQARNIAAAYVIVDILLGSMSRQAVTDWMISYSDYLYGVPAVEMHRRPEDVRMAALKRVMEGAEDSPFI